MSSPQRKAKVLFVYSTLSPFVHNDMKMLKEHFNVRSLNATLFLIPRRGKYLLAYLRLLKGILWANVVYEWWADLNAFFMVLICRFLRKKSIVVVGGYEVANVPEINYGSLLSPLRRLQVKFILAYASKVIAVSESSKNGILRFATPKVLRLVYNGVNTEKFSPSGSKENFVMTVVNTISPATVELKRLDTFLKASLYLPYIKFILVGEISSGLRDSLIKIGGSNVEFTGYLNHEALLVYYQKAKVYCQLSTHESFGVSLAEAMSCGCVPVVTRRYSLPEIVGVTGFYVPYNDPEATAEAIEKALRSDKGVKARERIRKFFSTEKRENILLQEIFDTIRSR